MTTLLRHQFQSLMMGLNLIIYVSHSPVNHAEFKQHMPWQLNAKSQGGYNHFEASILIMSLNLIIYTSHSSVNPAQSLNNICPGDLTLKARAGNHPNVVLSYTSRSQDPLAVYRRAGHNISHITTDV